MSSSDPKQPLAAPSHVYAAITDMNGIFRGKRVSAEKLDKLKKREASECRCPPSASTSGAQTRPVRSSPWSAAISTASARQQAAGRWTSAWMARSCPLDAQGNRRTLLCRWPASAAARARPLQGGGLTPVVASRVEFYLLDPASDGIAPARPQLGGPPREFDNIYFAGRAERCRPLHHDLYKTASARRDRGRTRPSPKARSGSSSSTSCTSRMR